MKKTIATLLVLGTAATGYQLIGNTDTINSEKEVIKITQDLEKSKTHKYKQIEKYSKDNYEYTVDNIVVWDGHEEPKQIGYEIHVKDKDGKIKNIKRMDGEPELMYETLPISTTTATSTL